ncbi:hypothetical protein [Nitrincola sp.]|uniref:hypothetical protein n=1 Tax=Nitrincola sp. TaxID=1926584 RepID=UPI003A93748F
MEHLGPGKKLYLDVRVAFVAAETTLNAWCNRNDINPANARQCLIGSWDGPKARLLRSRIINESGMASLSSIDSVTHSSAKQPVTTGAVEFFYWGC